MTWGLTEDPGTNSSPLQSRFAVEGHVIPGSEGQDVGTFGGIPQSTIYIYKGLMQYLPSLTVWPPCPHQARCLLGKGLAHSCTPGPTK